MVIFIKLTAKLIDTFYCFYVSIQNNIRKRNHIINVEALDFSFTEVDAHICLSKSNTSIDMLAIFVDWKHWKWCGIRKEKVPIALASSTYSRIQFNLK